jgi:hypothetical protein
VLLSRGSEIWVNVPNPAQDRIEHGRFAPEVQIFPRASSVIASDCRSDFSHVSLLRVRVDEPMLSPPSRLKYTKLLPDLCPTLKYS